MNGRLKHLKEEALAWAVETLDPDELNDYEWGVAIDEKFAELIVRECVSIVTKRKNQSIDDGWNVDEAMSMAEMDLLEHFGVEE